MRNSVAKSLAWSGIILTAAACGSTSADLTDESVLGAAEAVSACSCANGSDQRGVPIAPSATYCGFRVCGGDHQDYECTTGGWSAVAGSTCGYGSCQCAGGTDDQGRAIDPAATECGYRVCGGDHQFYTCQSSGWSGTGISCSSGGSSGLACLSAQAGAYCGNDSMQNGVASTLYQCPGGAGQAPTSSQSCANGCTVASPGVADHCAPGATCGSTCTQCVLSNRTDILPFYQSNGWDTSCGNHDSIVSNWCSIDPAGCSAVKAGACASSCGGGGSPLPCGKLGGQALTSTAGFQSLLKICPRVAKWIGVGSADFAAMQAFKSACPGSKTVLRAFGNQSNYATAGAMWSARYGFLDAATAAQKASIDFLESDNEADAGHGFANPQDYNAFLTQFVNLAASKGFHPLIGNIAVGNPGGNVDSCTGDGMLAFGAIVPAIQAAKAAGGGWGYHGYTQAWSKDVTAESYTALRYRKYVACYPQLASTPLILTEAGFDTGGNPAASGYLANGGAAPYVDWLPWYQRQIGGDTYVVGAALFAYASGSSWSSFQLDPVESQLESIIKTCP